jgi:hypothetical protein
VSESELDISEGTSLLTDHAVGNRVPQRVWCRLGGLTAAAVDDEGN